MPAPRAGSATAPGSPELPQPINPVLPAPKLPPAPSPCPDVPADIAALHDAVMPDDVGDPFFDAWPEQLASLTPGDILETRDVTATAAPLLTVPVRKVLQLKFRTTDSADRPSYATASLALPAAPWTGPGSRPVLVNNLAIDSLGRRGTPSYTLAHGSSFDTNSADFFPPITQPALLRGYAVLIPDHEGPNMAYAEPYVAGHAVLDSIRAARRCSDGELADSRFAMDGYSGGAIATRAAAVLIDTYAPELAHNIVGAALGGVPADYRMLSRTMNGNLASGVYMSAVFGIGREHSEILSSMNNLAQWVTTSPFKNAGVNMLGAPGLLQLPIDIGANIPDPLNSTVSERIYRLTDISDRKSAVPLYIYNGAQEWWVPADGARELYRQQCALGADATYHDVPGEHVIAQYTGWPDRLKWLDERLSGTSTH
ncbi:lipase family protein [Nocardia sp. JMUB6875]|uniref:lipase family protein n=1 Tax=Nocardia sp. JMUB6875 TaxID=3158170 RepID=UPI0034E891D4